MGNDLYNYLLISHGEPSAASPSSRSHLVKLKLISGTV